MNLEIDGTVVMITQYCMKRHLYEHLNLPGYSVFLNDVSVTLFDKTDPKDPIKRENYWIRTLKNKAPLRLRFEDGLQNKLIVFSFTYCILFYVYGLTVFGQRFSVIISQFLLFLMLLLQFHGCCCFWFCCVINIIVICFC